MLYLVHDFYENFMSAVECDDRIMLTDIINDEAAKLIVFDKGKVIEALKKAKIKSAKDKMTDGEIVQCLCDHMANNPALMASFTKMISDNNEGGKKNETLHNASGRSNEMNNTVPPDKRKHYISTALSNFIKRENKELLTKKVLGHKQVKEMNFGTDADNTAYDGEKTKVVLKAVAITTVIIVGGYFLGRFVVNKINQKNKPEEVAAGGAPAQTSPAEVKDGDEDDE